MRLVKQTEVDCMLNASAMVLDTTIERLIQLIGHNGMEVVYPKLPAPMCRRGVHIQEIIHAAWELDIGLIEFDPEPYGMHTAEVKRRIFKLTPHEQNIYLNCPTLWTGTTETGCYHAIAWDPETKQYFDSRGFQTDEPRIELHTCWAAVPITRPDSNNS